VGVKEARGYGWVYDERTKRVTKLEGVSRPQCSACFIVSVKDSLESILDLAKTEGMLFKWGSGTGSNLSALREEDAILSGGDPGMQFDTTVNKWHPCKNTSRINASNPCSEYMFLDDSACNLSSLNLMKFVGPDGQFDVEAFRHAVDTMILAQEIIVDNASYPT